MSTHACSLKDWAALISAVAWPGLLLFLILFFKDTFVEMASTITNAEAWGVKLTRLAQMTKSNAEQSVEGNDDFDKVRHLLDWNRVAAEVRAWALEHKAKNPSDMGTNNFKRFLHDAGLPGGKDVQLEWEPDGSLKYQ